MQSASICGKISSANLYIATSDQQKMFQHFDSRRNFE